MGSLGGERFPGHLLSRVIDLTAENWENRGAPCCQVTPSVVSVPRAGGTGGAAADPESPRAPLGCLSKPATAKVFPHCLQSDKGPRELESESATSDCVNSGHNESVGACHHAGRRDRPGPITRGPRGQQQGTWSLRFRGAVSVVQPRVLRRRSGLGQRSLSGPGDSH